MKKLIIGLLVLTSLNVFGQIQRYRVEKTTWDTNWGEIELTRDMRDNKITGKYVATNGKFVGNYNSSRKMYSGKFYNGKLKKWGFFRFDVSGKAFRGKWGWSTALKGGSWNGSFKDKKIYVRAIRTEADTEPIKLKVTLTSIGAIRTWDSDQKDDYLVSFLPTLKIESKSYDLKSKKFSRNGSYVERYGPKSALHIQRQKGQSDHAKVQLHVSRNNPLGINNSGIYEIPRNAVITDSNTDFTVKVVVDEVSSKTRRVFLHNDKINLKNALQYLKGERSASAFSRSTERCITYATGGASSFAKHMMGSGYRSLLLTTENGKRVVKDSYTGVLKSDAFGIFGEAYTEPVVTYTIELVD